MSIEILYPADREAWLAARGRDVTASVAGALIGQHPYMTRYQLWAEKTGRLTPENRSELAHQIGADEITISPLEMGLFLEAPVVDIVRLVRPNWTVEFPLGMRYFRDPKARLGATPDAFATDYHRAGQGVVQIKTTSEDIFRRDWLDQDTGEIILPLWIAIQTIVEADLTGADWAYVVVFVRGRTNRLFFIEVPINAAIKRRVRAEVAEFWRMIRAGESPPIDWDTDGETVLEVFGKSTPDRRDLTGDAEADKLISDYADARDLANAASKVAADFKPKIIAKLGNSEIGETKNWTVFAGTVYRGGHVVQPSESRPVRLKPKENLDDDDRPF